MERRDFLHDISQLTVAVCAGSLLAACSKSSDNNATPDPGGGGGGNALITANLTSELTAVGSSKTSGSVIVIRTAAGNAAASFVALSLICTHQQCTVNYIGDNGFKCPCHGSEYSVSGAVTMGPAPAPLKKYTVKVSGNTLTVS
ncbi:ubiquinol-cytochrome c reductase iron-sulfur subunit [Agriterribacter sp.]|uniref:QcrA and Rieske domain-containing protein n=1 Tax=Agriterribacter sp. TaxID=2821509 RepID=UPI002B82F0B8|nr:ubiquinol-cytochrome c reductase iron-sulfur subunit [Agriterribacter sp.]HTN09270.1 ubiquinol-cytochrome c reductase iron-sulfur subunit [Agriterribacter sp.]